MPVVAVGMVYAGGSALAAGVTGMAALAAGATLVGGAVSLVGTITGDKNLESDGMMVGTIGSLGMGATGVFGKEAAKGAATDAAGKAAASDAAMASDLGLSASEAGSSVPAAAMAQGTQEATALMSKFDALEKAQNMNMLGNVAQGVSSAYTGHQQKQMMEDQYNQRRADEQALIEERRRNMDLAGLSINTPKMPQILKPGLLNQPRAAINPVTGSGQTMMKLQG